MPSNKRNINGHNRVGLWKQPKVTLNVPDSA